MNTVIKGLYTLIRNEYCNELFKPLTVMLIIGFLLLSGYILFKCFEVIRSSYSYSFPSLRNSLLPSAEDIHHRLDKLNEESAIQPFFARTFHVDDNYLGLFGIDLADKAQCDRQYIYDTGIIGSETLLLAYNGVNIDGIVKAIITSSKRSTSSPRSKYLLATLRGVGGGKTRMIEETRIRMGILYPNWLPIAITFNHNSPISNSDYKLKDPDAIVAYAVCCRMMVAVYNIPMNKAEAGMDAALAMEGSESIDEKGGKFFAENLIVGTVQHIVERVKIVKPGLYSLVLFIDESVKLTENSNYPAEVRDGYAHLRQTMLGMRVGKIINTSLVMSSLSVSVFGKTESDQTITPVVLASKLSVDHIVDNIWIPSFHDVSSTLTDATERSMLKWLAASVGAAPRIVELMGRALREEFSDTWSSANSQGLTSRKSMGAVLSAFNQARDSSYGNVQFPVGKYLHALIYADIIVVDDTTLQYVRSSSFTNSITTFPVNEKNNLYLVPESALCLLASTTVVDSNDVIVKEIQNEFKAIWNNLLNHIIKSPLSSALGQPLEDVFSKVLRMRILSTHLKEVNPAQTTLKDLLAIDMSAIKYTIGGKPYNPAKISKTGKSVVQEGVNIKLDKWEAGTFDRAGPIVNSRAKASILSNLLSCEILVPKDVHLREIWSSSENITEWKESVKAIDSSLELDKPQPNNDHCDLMLFAKMVLSSWWRTKISGEDEIVIVFEDKSSRGENNDSNRIWWGHFIEQGKAGKEKGPYDQYEKFCKAVASITESDLEGDRGYLRALMEGRFIYVYVTTHDGPTVYLASQDLPHIQSNSLGVLVLNREVTQRILGVTFYDVYALR